MAPFGLKLCQNAFQVIPDVSFLDDKNIKNFQNFRELWTAVYLPRMAPIGLRLGQYTFQTIPDVSFFKARNDFFQKQCLNMQTLKVRLPPEDGSD